MLSVNPSELEVAANVRKDVNLTPEFVKSIKLHGVLVPIIVTPGLEGYAVIDGQRRALAAVEAGLKEVPVVVVDALPEEKDRIVTQLVVNDNREGVGAADTVAAVRELALFGMSATAIAKNLGEKKATVDKALVVAGSEGAMSQLSAGATFDNAVLLAEFDDYPEAQADLIEKAEQGWGSLEHVAQRWRDERGLFAVATALALEGFEVIEAPDGSDPLAISRLYHDEGLSEPLTEEEAMAFKGDGLCAWPAVGWEEGERVFHGLYALRGWKEKGLHTYSWIEDRGGKKKPETPEEVEAAKAERREVRENTKAWKSATVVRVEFLAKVLGRARMPKGFEVFVAQHVLRSSGHSAGEWDMIAMLLGIEGVDTSQYHSRIDAVARFLAEAPQRANAVMLASALAAVEGGYEFGSKGWRHGDTTVAYLKLLQGWGYGLSEIEAEVVG